MADAVDLQSAGVAELGCAGWGDTTVGQHQPQPDFLALFG
jgi:hypothetical protein